MNRVERANDACAEAFARYRALAREAQYLATAASRAAREGQADLAQAHARAHRTTQDARTDALRRYDLALLELHAALVDGAGRTAPASRA